MTIYDTDKVIKEIEVLNRADQVEIERLDARAGQYKDMGAYTPPIRFEVANELKRRVGVRNQCIEIIKKHST